MSSTNTAGVPELDKRQHFVILDGLRGVAALAVVTFHFMEMAIPDYRKIFIGHGFLAVDFFFCLSGFVIGYAYDGRLEKMGFAGFLKARLIRLHPLVIFGSVLGLLAIFADPFVTSPVPYSVGQLSLLFAASLFLIPYPAMADRGFNLFGLNAPAWSLFWEYIANLVYATVLYKVRRSLLILLTICAGVLLCYVGAHAGKLSGGWSGKNFWDGGARVAYSFLAGLLIYRCKWMIRSRLGFGGLSVMLLLALVMPYARGGWGREALVILLYFPLLVSLGAGGTLIPKMEKLCVLSGEISYPLYMTHYAVIWIFGDYYDRYKPGTGMFIVVVSSGVVCMLGFAYVVLRLYDFPVRKYLRQML